MPPLPESRRRYLRLYAARRREAKLAAKNLTARTCQRWQGPGQCGGVLEDRVDRALGKVVRTCPRCERRKAGLCQDCPRPVYGARGRAVRCAPCAARRRKEQTEAWAREHLDELRASRRRHYQADPDRRARRNAYKRLYRRAHRDQIRKEKRAAGIRHNRAREKMLAWHRRYNAERRAHKAAVMTKLYRDGHPVPQPACTQCQRTIPYLIDGARRPSGEGRPPTRCVFCMRPAQLRRAVRNWIARTNAELTAPAPRKARRVKPWKPRARETRLTKLGERLCWTDSCAVVVRGREKKCARCKAREAHEAAALLESHRGRGRRTDLVRRSA